MAKNNIVKVGGELKSIAADSIVASADGIFDYNENKTQEELNQEFKENSGYVKPEGGIPKADLASTVQSSLSKADNAQEKIDTVNVNVDNNTGTPSGSASVSGSTLTINFNNIKGAKGDTGAPGAQGIQGVQGERGPVGANGVTTDATIAIITGINTTTTYDSTKDVASAEAVQDILKMLGVVYYVSTT